MLTLTPNEARVLGVLIEKAQTTPAQYPMTLNAMVSGANQKNNREPVTSLTEAQVLEALDGLRVKRMINEVMLSGSRVQKYRHIARETLEITTSELVILTELLLRGPQTIGELRGRASRMHPLESTDIVKNVLDSLMQRVEPMVRELPPAAGDRSPRYMQLLCPNLHPETTMSPARDNRLGSGSGGAAHHLPISQGHADELANRVGDLEQEVARLRHIIEEMATSLGATSLIQRAD